ncbi:outer membrane protein assembly factor BamE [Chitinimonas sp. BJYL2]|uniref:outer membrane protein assembly factor BamE n=1 Tax=Chitinimonas sp. BJYL2 TaxID=2976696 RepID=UPI0022B4E0B5|nr:outer membrane protein assembly factor BamE [Chitinimonas sp. BJYL2]
MRILLISLLLACLPACSYLTPYKLDVPQGNPLTADQVAKLKIGMTRAQVRFALGTPMLVDTFHGNRWEYQYYDSKDGKIRNNKRYSVQFDGDRLISMGGETLPAKAIVAEKAPEDPRAAAKALQQREKELGR